MVSTMKMGIPQKKKGGYLREIHLTKSSRKAIWLPPVCYISTNSNLEYPHFVGMREGDQNGSYILFRPHQKPYTEEKLPK